MPVSFSIAFVAGVTPTKWTRIWGDRRPDVPLTVFRTEMVEQIAVLHDGLAEVQAQPGGAPRGRGDCQGWSRPAGVGPQRLRRAERP